MTGFFEFTLILSVFLIVYNIALYPVAIMLIAKWRTDPHRQHLSENEDWPLVSMIIAAFNEEKVIEDKIRNSLALDYPRDKLQIIVVSDGSDDSTHAIASRYEEKGICAMHEPERRGKSAALNRGLSQANGDIILFSDANNDFSANAVKALVRHFNDEQIGAVTGAKGIYASDNRESAQGDGIYWQYESKIKQAESDLGSITAAEGEILAVRRDLMRPINPKNINDDAAITFDIVNAGYRVLYEPAARSLEQASLDLLDDINVKIRMTAGGFQTIANHASFLLPPRNWFAFSFFSHKILRWLTPHLMMLVLICNWFLLDTGFYQLLLFAQFVFYGLALYGWLNRSDGKQPLLVYLPMYFSVMNYAVFKGFLSYLKGVQGVNWKKAAR